MNKVQIFLGEFPIIDSDSYVIIYGEIEYDDSRVRGKIVFDTGDDKGFALDLTDAAFFG